MGACARLVLRASWIGSILKINALGRGDRPFVAICQEDMATLPEESRLKDALQKNMGTLRAPSGNRSQLIMTGSIVSAVLSLASFLLAFAIF